MTAASPAPSSMPRPLAAWLSILLLIAVALVKTILSKTIFDQLPTPIAYSLGSAVVTWLLVALPLAYNGELKCMRPTDLWRVGLVSVAVTLDLGMSNIAIALLPLPLQQAIASAIPAATVLLESAVTRRLKPPTTYLTILLLCGGAITMHFGSIPTYQPSIGRGEVAMGLAICFAALKYVFAKASLQAWKASYGALGVLLWIETFIALQMLPWAYYSGELGLAAAILSERSVASIALLCAAAALGGFRFYCELVVLRYWSATTLSAANLMAHALIVALATPCAHGRSDSNARALAHSAFVLTPNRMRLRVSSLPPLPQALGDPTARCRAVHAADACRYGGHPHRGSRLCRPQAQGRAGREERPFDGRHHPG